MDEYLRNTAASRKGAELRKRVAALEATALEATILEPAAGASAPP
jgi:hypothetical protein